MPPTLDELARLRSARLVERAAWDQLKASGDCDAYMAWQAARRQLSLTARRVR